MCEYMLKKKKLYIKSTYLHMRWLTWGASLVDKYGCTVNVIKCRLNKICICH